MTLSIFVGGCQDAGTADQETLSQLVEEEALLHLGNLDQPGPDLFAGPLGAVNLDSHIVILDSGPPFIRVFSSRGEPLFTAFERGEGPLEMRGPTSMAVLDESIAVMDRHGIILWHPSEPDAVEVVPYPPRITQLGSACGGSLVGSATLAGAQGVPSVAEMFLWEAGEWRRIGREGAAMSGFSPFYPYTNPVGDHEGVFTFLWNRHALIREPCRSDTGGGERGDISVVDFMPEGNVRPLGAFTYDGYMYALVGSFRRDVTQTTVLRWDGQSYTVDVTLVTGQWRVLDAGHRDYVWLLDTEVYPRVAMIGRKVLGDWLSKRMKDGDT